MCGIAGARRFGAEPMTAEMIQALAMGIEDRGMHATGIALQAPSGHIRVLKAAVPAWEFVTMDETEEWLAKYLPKAIIALVHTRHWTKGTPEINENNHPVFDGDTAIVHNGVIYNDDTLFDTMNLDRVAETDSDIIRAIIAEHGITKKGIRQLSRMRGGAAVAAISKKQPGKLLLLRSGSPLVLANKGDIVAFCSVKGPLIACFRKFRRRFGITMREASSGMAFVTFAEDTAWILGKDGQELHQEFALDGAASRRGSKAYTGAYNSHEAYPDKMAQAAAEAKRKLEEEKKAGDVLEGAEQPADVDFIVCPYKSCKSKISVVDLQVKEIVSLTDLKCPECRGWLDGRDEGREK